MNLTRRGTGLLLSVPVLAGTGFVFGYPELAVLASAALLAVLFAALYALWRPRLAVTRAADPDRVMRGEPSTVTLTVRNTSRMRAVTLIAYDRCGPALVPVPLLQLRPNCDMTTSYPVPTDRRGVVHIGPLRVDRVDPLGLVRTERSHGHVNRVWVYPKVHQLTAVPVGVVRSLDGRIDRVPHGSITFDTLREYVVGDELRHVHWRTTARIGELMVREHVDTSLPRLVVLLDDRIEAYPDGADDAFPVRAPRAQFEAACEAAASVVMAAAREDLPVALRLVGGPGAGGDGRRLGVSTRTVEFLDLLAEAQLVKEPGGTRGRGRRTSRLDEATARLRQRRLGDTLIFLTGSGRLDDIGVVGGLRGAYPSLVVGAFGPAKGLGRPAACRNPDPSAGAAPSAIEGLLVLSATDGVEFARAWEGVRSW
jgi:uncharacterized protein (DUF58 family)